MIMIILLNNPKQSKRLLLPPLQLILPTIGIIIIQMRCSDQLDLDEGHCGVIDGEIPTFGSTCGGDN